MLCKTLFRFWDDKKPAANGGRLTYFIVRGRGH